MGDIDDRLQELGLVLPAPMEPPGNFELVTVHDGLAYIAGHAPISGSEVLVQGAVGSDLTLEDGYRAARLTGLSILASLKDTLGDLDRHSGTHCHRERVGWRPAVARDSSWRRLTRFRIVARGLTCQRCVAAAFPRPSSVT